MNKLYTQKVCEGTPKAHQGKYSSKLARVYVASHAYNNIKHCFIFNPFSFVQEQYYDLICKEAFLLTLGP